MSRKLRDIIQVSAPESISAFTLGESGDLEKVTSTLSSGNCNMLSRSRDLTWFSSPKIRIFGFSSSDIGLST